MFVCLFVCLFDCLIVWLFDWLIDWLFVCVIFALNFKNVNNWTCILRQWVHGDSMCTFIELYASFLWFVQYLRNKVVQTAHARNMSITWVFGYRMRVCYAFPLERASSHIQLISDCNNTTHWYWRSQRVGEALPTKLRAGWKLNPQNCWDLHCWSPCVFVWN